MNVSYLSAVEQQRLVAAGDISAVELLDACLVQYEVHNPTLNAVVVTQLEQARADARRADERFVAGERVGPLHGLVLTVKDSIDWSGAPSTWGDPQHESYMPTEDADVLKQLRAAGAVVYGKTNVPLHLGDWQSYNEVYGRTNNPWGHTRSAGGSSGGSAVSVATGMASLEVGSDIGGSIRWPANYNGVAGLKPSFGLVSQHGHSFPGNEGTVDNNVVGPIARTVADLDLALSVMAEPHMHPPRSGKQRLADFRVGVMLDNPLGATDQAVADVHRSTVDRLLEAGITVVDPPPTDFLVQSHEVGMEIVRASATGPSSPPTDAEFARYDDGIRDFDALNAQAHRVTHREWIDLNNERERGRLKWRDYFSEVDLLLTPIAPTTAPPHDTERPFSEQTVIVNGEEQRVMDQWFWAGLANPTYLPAVAFPVGLANDGLPVGMQAVGPFMADRTALRFGMLAEDLLGHPLKTLQDRPGFRGR